ncbi:MAG: hypothetical protein ACR5K4_03840 [Sodalis sp. (in: enterobacteria)]
MELTVFLLIISDIVDHRLYQFSLLVAGRTLAKDERVTYPFSGVRYFNATSYFYLIAIIISLLLDESIFFEI